MTSRPAHSPSVAIVGGGLAGLAAGCALADVGFQVTLFERRPYLGGRASSYQHPGTGEIVDNCQHVLLGCCTNLIQFYERLGVQDKIRWYDRLTFLEPGGRASIVATSGLPAPLHTAPSFLRVSCLSFADKIVIARAMFTLAFDQEFQSSARHSAQTGESFLSWLQRHDQTPRAIDRFWKTILVSALNEDLDRVSVRYAAQVVRESFLKSPQAGCMGVPTVPLTELYSVAGDYIQSRGGELRLRSSVEGFEPETSGVRLFADKNQDFDFVILAASFDVLSRILPQTGDADALRSELNHFESSPITGIHMWFDRQITDLDHAVLLERTIQWMFHKSKLLTSSQAVEREGKGSYVELVVSSSKTLVEKSKAEIVELALKELREFFPAARDANLVKSTVIKEVNATYSPSPGLDAYRPKSETVWPNIFLAGDWIATGWPATMEGAVRSGYIAAERVSKASGRNAKFLVPDLPASGLMRVLS
ncbi:MAG TPA: hydroxysqualene dehydroxylase HpnE [Terriglobales bacterium]|nr:hydroxysqualene dehydroxylase HpnE [Terriglobales bacterium]